MRALLIANSNDCDAGFSGEQFRSHGFAFVECHRERPAEWPSLEGIDQVLLLGSDWSLYWPHVAAEVNAERALVAAAHAAGIPIYGICFGAQILASALGGTVQRAARPEIGWVDDIESTVPQVRPAPRWMQWHSDVITVPPGAAELARSPLCPQAFRLGRSFATQFHPEVTESIVARWTGGPGAADELSTVGLTVEQLRADTATYIGRSRPAAQQLVDWYLREVAGGPAT